MVTSTKRAAGNNEAYAPWIEDPDDPADSLPMTQAEAETAAGNLAALFPDIFGDAPVSSAPLPPSTARVRDPMNAHIAQTFREAIAHLDASEPEVRNLIENGLFDVAGINRTKVSDAVTSGRNLAIKIADVRAKHIKRAFRHLRDRLPHDI